MHTSLLLQGKPYSIFSCITAAQVSMHFECKEVQGKEHRERPAKRHTYQGAKDRSAAAWRAMSVQEILH